MASIQDLYEYPGVEQSGGSIYVYQDGANVELATHENGLWRTTVAGEALLATPVPKAKKGKPVDPQPAGDLDLG